MNTKKIRKLSLVLFYIGLLCFSILFITGFLKNGLIVVIQIIIGTLCISTSFILNLMFWRCPHCGKKFELKNGAADKTDLCPYCGKKI